MPANVTLHAEIAAILSGSGREWMTTAEIADEVNDRGNYRKGDLSPVTAFQVHGRTRNYQQLFERDGSRVRLRAVASKHPASRHPPRVPAAPTRPSSAAAPARSSDLVEEAVAALSQSGISAEDAEGVAPREPGLYAISATGEGLRELGLEGADVIYVGKSESSLEGRDLGQHFAVGETGRSTLRRSLSALLADELGMMPRPRNPARPADFDRYGLDEGSDRLLSEWMRRHLRLAFWAAPRGTVLKPIEVAIIGRLTPPLNLTYCVTPYTAGIKARRRIMADRARNWASSTGG